MSSILENISYYHEDIECLELAAAEILLAKARKELRSSSDHCIDYLVRQIQQEAAAVSRLDVDLDGRKGDEIRQIGGEGSLDVWHSFYSKLRDSKEYSKRHSDKYQVCLSLSLISCHFLDCAGTGRYTLDTRSFIILGWKNEEHVSG